MLDKQQRRWAIPFIVGVVVLSIDQISKIWIVRTLGPEPLRNAWPLLGDWLRLVFSQNTGVAFSLFQGMSGLFIVTSALIAAGAIYVYWTQLPNHNAFIQVSLGLIEGGAIGNVIDRIRLGYVVDFIQVGWWPVFNLADSAITCGVAILAVYLLLAGEQSLSPDQSPSPRDGALLSELLDQDVGSSSDTKKEVAGSSVDA